MAPNDEPYSTRRCSPRWYQTRCGISWTSGCAPVAIEERQTGVSEGKVEIGAAVAAVLGEQRERGRGAALERVLEHRRRQAVDDDRGSAFGAISVAGEDAQPGVPLGRARRSRRPEDGHARPPRGSRRPERTRARRGRRRRAATSSAGPPRVPPRRSAPGDDDRGGSAADERRRPPRRRLGPVVDQSPTTAPRGAAEHDGRDPAERRRREQPGEEHAERRPRARARARSCTSRPSPVSVEAPAFRAGVFWRYNTLTRTTRFPRRRIP